MENCDCLGGLIIAILLMVSWSLVMIALGVFVGHRLHRRLPGGVIILGRVTKRERNKHVE